MSNKALASTVHIPKRIFLILVDHSVLGVWTSRRKAETAVAESRLDNISRITWHVAGPYILQVKK